MTSTAEASLWAMLAKHGPWAFWSCILLFILWTFTLQPMADERRMLLTTFEANRRSMERVAESTEHICDSVDAQRNILAKLDATLEESSVVAEGTRDCLESHWEQVKEDLPKMDGKLDTIIEATKP